MDAWWRGGAGGGGVVKGGEGVEDTSRQDLLSSKWKSRDQPDLTVRRQQRVWGIARANEREEAKILERLNSPQVRARRGC